MALVLTLMAVSFLVAITVQLTTSVNWQMQGAGNLRDSVQLDAISRSGLSLARAALLADLKKNNFDSEHDSWGVKLTEDAQSLFGQGKVTVEVTDLSGKLQVNALVPDKNQKQGQRGQTTPQQQQQHLPYPQSQPQQSDHDHRQHERNPGDEAGTLLGWQG